MQASERLLALGGDAALSRQWILPIWEAMVHRDASNDKALSQAQRVHLVRILEQGFGEAGNPPEVGWLSRIEAAQMANPRDPVLQYLAGVVCMRLSLWGKAQQMLKQSLSLLQDHQLKRDAWHALAALAEIRQDKDTATESYRQALKEATRT